MANYNIAYLIELKDRFTTVAKNVAKNNKIMQKTFEGLKSGIQKANEIMAKAQGGLRKFGDSAKNLGGSLKGLGKDLQGASLAIGGLFWKSLRNWEKQASAIASLDNNLKTRARSLGMTSEQVQKMASEMQAKSVFGDEDIIQNVTNQLLTFDKVNGDVFKRANQSVLDMTSKIYGANATAEQMRPIALAVGKALNNPAEAMNSLGRVGVKFTAQQQKAVKQLVATGQSAKAQEFIMRSLEQRYKGSAEVLGNTQPLKQLTNAFNDMLEPLGQIVQEFLIPLVKVATKMIAVFNGFNKPIKTVIVTIMGLIAISAPLLNILGGTISAIGTISSGVASAIGVFQKLNLVSKIATAVQWLFNTSLYGCPIVWIIAGIIAVIAIVVLLIKNWQAVVDYLQFVWNFWKDFFSGIWQAVVEFATGFWKSITEAVGNIWNAVKTVFENIKNFIKDNFINILLTALGPIGLIIQGIMKVGNLVKQIGSDSANVEVEHQIKGSEASSKNSVDVNGQIVVSAEKGSKVQKTSSKAKSKSKGNVGFNLAKAGA